MTGDRYTVREPDREGGFYVVVVTEPQEVAAFRDRANAEVIARSLNTTDMLRDALVAHELGVTYDLPTEELS